MPLTAVAVAVAVVAYVVVAKYVIWDVTVLVINCSTVFVCGNRRMSASLQGRARETYVVDRLSADPHFDTGGRNQGCINRGGRDCSELFEAGLAGVGGAMKRKSVHRSESSAGMSNG